MVWQQGPSNCCNNKSNILGSYNVQYSITGGEKEKDLDQTSTSPRSRYHENLI
jgi:hypothetical protein